MGLQLSSVILSSPSVEPTGASQALPDVRGPEYVVKIRYATLPSGLHVRAVARGNDTLIYLLPGLTTEQREAALRRMRSSARMGQGPPLPPAGLAIALLEDRILTTVKKVTAAMRVHPAMLLPLFLILLATAVAYSALSSDSIKIRSPQEGGVPEILIGPPAAEAAGPSPASKNPDPGQPGGLVPGSPRPGRSGAPSLRPSRHRHRAERPWPWPEPVPTWPGQPPSPSPSPGPGPSAPSPWPSGSWSPSPCPSQSPWPSWSGTGSPSQPPTTPNDGRWCK